MSTNTQSQPQQPVPSLDVTFREYLHLHWKAYAFQGLLMVVMGALALAAPWAATIASTLFVGWLLIIGGILGCVAAIKAYRHKGFWSNFALALLAIALGVVIVYDPFAGAVTLTWALSVYFGLSACAHFWLAGSVRNSSRAGFWALVVTGLLNVALAAVLVLGLPGTATWALGMYIGISFIFTGTSLLCAALDARKAPPAGQ